MGVHGLWELLAPVGRRVSVETLAGKKLAIDASIWMVQFMKAMRDEKGEMIRNAHFAAPSLLDVDREKTLRLRSLKQMRLKELAKDLDNQRKMQKNNNKDKGKMVSSDNESDTNFVGCNANVELTKEGDVKLKEKLEVPSIAKDGGHNEDEDEDEVIILPDIDGNIDPDVLAALPQSMQRQLLKQTDAKGKKILLNDLNQSNKERSSTEHDAVKSTSYSQEKLDEMLAASLASQEDSNLANASTSVAAIPSEEDGDEDEEMILPAMHGNVDPAVLAALPPSLQLDLLGQMRERLMAENRQKYQKVKKAPEKFSELQVQSYLKTVAFRREIDEVQRAAAGRGVAGVQTSRIASEANREFIFSSSFTGDKQALTSARKERDEDKQQERHSDHPSGFLGSVKSSCKSNVAAESVPDESTSTPDEDVGTYLDETGRVRVSRVRGMGIRMTRDLQRNLDLMKEIEKERTNLNKGVNVQSVPDKSKIDASKSVSNGDQFVETSRDDNGESVNVNESNQQSAFETEACMEITFDDDGKTEYFDDDDDIFARLAAGDPVTLPSPEEKSLRKQASGSDSDFEWEEGVVEGKWDGVTPGMNAEHNLLNKESNITDDSEVEWEEEPSDAPKSSSGAVESGRMLSKGYWEEESDLQEAIRRSLTDVGVEKSNSFPSDFIESKNLGEKLDDDFESLHEKGDTGASRFPGDAVNWQNKSCENLDRPQKPCTVNEPSISETLNSPERPSPVHNSDKNMTMLSKFSERSDGSHSEQSRHNETAEFVATPEKEVDFPTGKHLDVSEEVDGLSTISDSWFKDNSRSFDAAHDKKTGSEDEPSNLVSDKKSSVEAEILDQDKKIDFEAKPSQQSVDTVDLSIPTVQSSANKVIFDLHIEQELSGDRTYENCVNKAEQHTDMSTIKGNDNEEIKFSKASLDEELLILDQECINMVDEQRKLERNAESVSSEMFAECQELLQMFGLPYIIAPMEAEAQCAYMELTNLVDGVVTDDSDVFLFGARSVYKNIFDDRKYVETYFMQDIEKELGLTREKLMRMALLLGSDYTEGVSGIGIVNAIEVVNAFPEEDGLHKFREWIESPDPTILGKLNVQEESSAWKRGPKSTEKDVNSTKTSTGGSESNNGESSLDQNSFQADKNMQSADGIDDIKQIFMDKHRNVSKNWHIPSSFPSEAVISAYSLPQVDKSTEPFTWGRPDLFVLRKLCWEKFGWGSQKSDELLLPVLREYEKRETQLRMEAFYTFNERFAKIRSKRIKKAVKGITGNQSSELIDDGMQQVSKSKKKRRVSPVQSGDDKSGEPSNRKEDIASRCQSKSTDKSVPKTSRKRQNSGKDVSFEMRTPEPQLQTLRRRKTNKQSAGNGRGRGSGEGRRHKGSSGFQQCETSSSGGDSGNDNQEVDGEKLDQPREVRRSMRTRNPVNYTMNDLEDEGGLSHKESSSEDAMEKEAGEDVKEKIQCEAREPSLDNIDGDYLETGGGFCMDERGTDLPDANQDVDLETEPTNDYLKMGGGFCMEGDIDQPDTSQDVSPLSETGSANDYLKMGGGFCMEESETIDNPDAGNYQDPVQATESSNCFAFTDKADNNIDSAEPSVNAEGSPLDKLQNGGKTPNEANDALNLNHQNAANKDDSKESASLRETSDVGTAFISGLSAMPSLKRKRRRR
ncbi:DNA repair protein UVH3 isoform X3 [Gossypium australe]|uniref:DNA repair protein UVH3 isoform X3 n=1 Tax=Gossypium australe TaxID=47621 RepID=A0A5B6UYX8_9ROSI|nr:DNA repair protein UVH3 isoform X3 [Gossypium australe]